MAQPDRAEEPGPNATPEVARVSSALEVEVAAADYDVVVDLLWQYGPNAVTEAATPTGVTLTVAYPGDCHLERVRAALSSLDARVRVHPEVGDWVAAWRTAATPLVVGPFGIRLPEHDAPLAAAIDLIIDPGPSFGFGHPSTALALALVSTSTHVSAPGGRVADVGCGSGILSIAMAKLGFQPVDAVDIDPDAVEITRRNATLNRCAIRCRRGSLDSLPRREYSLVVANLTAATLRQLRSGLEQLVAADGELVLSGMLADQAVAVTEQFAGFEPAERVLAGEWVALRLQRRREERAGASQDPAL